MLAKIQRERRLGEALLRSGVEKIGVAAGAVVEKTAGGGERLARFGESRLELDVGEELGKPVDDAQIAEAAGRFLEIGLEALRGVAVLGVARAGGMHEAQRDLAGRAGQGYGQAIFEAAAEFVVVLQGIAGRAG